MKKLILTSPKYDGEVYVVYGPDSRLMHLDFSAANLEYNQIEVMKQRIPVHLDRMQEFEAALKSKFIEVIESDYKLDFSHFWEKYNKKVNKIRTEKPWDKLSAADRVKAVFGITAYHNHLKLNTWKNKVDPERYLKDRYWENKWK